MSRIIVRICGGIGNQLFAYSAARRLSLVNGAELVIDSVSGFSRDFNYQREFKLYHFNININKATSADRFEPFSRIRRYIKRFINNRRFFNERNYIQPDGIDFDPRLLEFKPHGTVYLEGYWQSEKYFKDIEDIIRDDLRIIPPANLENISLAKKINNSVAIAVHVRFFNSLDDPTYNNNASIDYYSRAIKKIESLVSNAHYFIFSDRPDLVRDWLDINSNQVTYIAHNKSDENAYADLWLMTQCKHFIIANSTFSWWGAWLSDNKDKVVIAPGFEVREGVSYWGFEGLIPENWIKY
ncbi:MAG: alpha-1,2-fucosyltransferase [Sedimenticola sp.]